MGSLSNELRESKGNFDFNAFAEEISDIRGISNKEAEKVVEVLKKYL